MKNRKEEPQKPSKPLKHAHLIQYSAKHIKEVLAEFKGTQRVEITEYLLQLFSDIAEYHATKNIAVCEAYLMREEALLKRYGKLFKPVVSKSFYKLFDFQLLLTETGYYTSEEFNALKDQANQLSERDVENWTNSIKYYLRRELQIMYLDQEPQFEILADEELSGKPETGDNEMTEARSTLAEFYILKAGFNIDPHGTNPAHTSTAVARLLHLLRCKPLTKPQNSNIYKKYLKMPKYNSGNDLLKDLEYIRPFFKDLDIKTVLEMIDKEIESTKNK